uniref:Uncharacterized protein n=1 Tax=Anguilla anguilla TaxID=7936 RepID=A0A0E9WM48_ANGAN
MTLETSFRKNIVYHLLNNMDTNSNNMHTGLPFKCIVLTLLQHRFPAVLCIIFYYLNIKKT